MFPAKGSVGSGAVGERVFFSADVTRMAGVTLRQLQWWDERKVVAPRKEDHRRVYLPQQVLEILIVAALRRKGLSLRKIRRILRLLRRELAQPSSKAREDASKVYLLTDIHSVRLEDEAVRILEVISAAPSAMYLVSLSDLIKRITSEEAPRRYWTRQLQLF
jgi:DNA-binding transcriptional MerR regulator